MGGLQDSVAEVLYSGSRVGGTKWVSGGSPSRGLDHAGFQREGIPLHNESDMGTGQRTRKNSCLPGFQFASIIVAKLQQGLEKQ